MAAVLSREESSQHDNVKQKKFARWQCTTSEDLQEIMKVLNIGGAITYYGPR
jgi:hypothetical protein